MWHFNFEICFLLLMISIVDGGAWYNWSNWSKCSVSCDGGLTNRRRLCLGGNCLGQNIQYKICNTNICKSSTVLPAYEACQSQNEKKIHGGLYKWVPRTTEHQCSVYCVEETNRIPNLVSVNLVDGFRCSTKPYHYCIDGKCMNIGCDGYVDSRKVSDNCGRCGGDGTSCNTTQTSQSLFDWTVQWTSCSKSCGTGFQLSSFKCKDVKNGQTVPDFYCEYNNKPEENTKECSLKDCLPQWKTSSWNSCSVACGGGVQKRKVLCTQETGRARTTEIADYRCPDPIPPSERPCNTQFCPSVWQTGDWTQCSVTCGVGVQDRPVYCMKSFVRGMNVNVSDNECLGPKPQSSRPCSHPPCFQLWSFQPHIKQDNYTFIQLKKSKTIRLNVGVKAVLLPRQAVKIECPVKNFEKSHLFWTKNSRLISTSVYSRVYVTSRGALKIRRTDPKHDQGVYTCMAGMESADIILEFQSIKIAREKAKKIKNEIRDNALNEVLNKPQSDVIPGSGPQNVPALPTGNKHSKQSVYLTSDWTKCSRTCGVGFQTRKVTCNVVTEKYMKIVPDNQCQDKVPVNHRICTDNPYCPVWRSGNWSQCSVDSCQFDGLAQQTRKVYCGAENNDSITLPIKRCDQQSRPENQRQCANDKCIAVWRTGKWTKCKPLCAKKGKKYRLLTCVWKHNKTSARDNCRTKPKPEVRKLCMPKYCSRKCNDTSRYCSIAKVLHLCRYTTFQHKCCATCGNRT